MRRKYAGAKKDSAIGEKGQGECEGKKGLAGRPKKLKEPGNPSTGKRKVRG